MMMRRPWLICALLACSASAAEVPPQTPECDTSTVKKSDAVPDVSVEKVEFHGWKNAIRLSNRVCEMVVVPEISRVMYFGLKGGANLIWIAPSANGQSYSEGGSDWRNLGGDKIWPEPQDVFGWPPPYFFDNAPSTAEVIPGGVRLKTEKASPRLGSVCVREFVLNADKALVNVRQRLEKIQGQPAAMTLWNVTQVCAPDYALLPLGPEDEAKRPYRCFNRSKLEAPYFHVHDTVLTLRNDESGPKVGVSPNADGSNGWVAAVYHDCMLVESRKIEKGANYPDNQCHAELFSAPSALGPYVELELLSPLKTLKVGQQLADDSVWQIVPLTAEQSHDPERAAAVARKVHSDAMGISR
jgi:hypothetical protein